MTELNLASELGAGDEMSMLRFSIYLADRDQDNKKVADIEDWVRAGMELLAEANSGVTRLPWADGMWHSGADMPDVPPKRTSESTAVIYSYIRDLGRFAERLPSIRSFLHDYGRRTKQGSVMVEVSGELGAAGFYQRAYFINSYDDPTSGA